MTAWTFLWLAIAGGLGAGARYVVDVLVMRGRTDAFPLGILIVNLTGSFALGILTGLGAALLGEWLVIIGLGLLGGYTTFATVSVESVLLAQRRRTAWMWVNLLGTLIAAVIAAGIGLALGRLFT